jgi:hypothetical protein
MKQIIDFKTKKQSPIGKGIKEIPSGLLKWHFFPIYSKRHFKRDNQHLGRDGPPGRTINRDMMATMTAPGSYN